MQQQSHIVVTGVAVALAVAVAVGFLLFGSQVFAPFGGSRASETASSTALTLSSAIPMNDSTNAPLAPLPTELTVTDEVVGTGAEAKAGDTVSVNYVGMLPDGTVFDASSNHGGPFSFQLGAHKVIQGWDQGLVGMKVGGKRHLIIPPDMAYGNQAVGNVIPPNATLVFDVELTGVQ